MSIQYFTINSQINIAYTKLEGKGPGIIFCCGFMSDMQGIKAKFVENICRENNVAFVKFDYSAHGQSTGVIEEANISAWLRDSLAILDHLTEGPQIIVGSSMGAWLALLLAKARPERIKKLITLAAAPDFVEDIIWQRLPSDQKAQLLRNEILYFPAQYGDKPYTITRQFIEDGRKHLLLRSPIAISCDVHLLHGMQDADVNWQTSIRLAELIQSDAIKLTLIKDGDHRLAREQDLKCLQQLLLHN